MNLRLILFTAAMVVSVAGCVRDRDIELPDPGQPGAADTLRPQAGMIFINEFVAKGSANSNEFGTQEDWIELYNPAPRTLYIPPNTLFATDDANGEPLKYALPSVSIPARGFLLLWCDDLDTVATEIHTNFKLSSGGDHPGITVRKDGVNFLMDDYLFGPQATDAASNGRSPDGAPDWIIFNNPTPGDRNL